MAHWPNSLRNNKMNMQTNYLGMELKNPLVPAASPRSKELDSAKRLEDAGAAAIVMACDEKGHADIRLLKI